MTKRGQPGDAVEGIDCGLRPFRRRETDRYSGGGFNREIFEP